MSSSKCPNCSSLQDPKNINYLGDEEYNCPNCKTSQQRLEELYNLLPNEEIKTIVSEIVELEISIEQDCNQ